MKLIGKWHELTRRHHICEVYRLEDGKYVTLYHWVLPPHERHMIIRYKGHLYKVTQSNGDVIAWRISGDQDGDRVSLDNILNDGEIVLEANEKIIIDDKPCIEGDWQRYIE